MTGMKVPGMNRSDLKAAYFKALQLLRVDTGRINRLRQLGLTPILNFHQVSPVVNPYWSPLAPDLFDDLLGYITRHFDVRSLSGGIPPKGRRPSIILSFDDGYASFVEYAVPILAKHGLTANQNIIPTCALSGLPPWNIRLYDFLNAAPRSLIDQLQVPGFAARLGGDGTTEKSRYGLALIRFLKNRPRIERQALWPGLDSVMAKADPYAVTKMMTVKDIRQVAGDHEIGVHSYAHESMGHESLDYFTEDLRQCQAFFRETLDLPLTIYAFPNGSYRDEHVAHLKAQGIAHTLLVGEKLATCSDGVYPRLTLYGNSAAEVRLRAVGLASVGQR